MVGKPIGKTQLGGFQCGWENDIKMDLKEGGWVWTGFIWLRTKTSGELL
jgi:hypothetical protein